MSITFRKEDGSTVTFKKFNPYHDSRGRFSGAGGAASFTYSPGKSRAHDLAIQRAKEQTAGENKPYKVKTSSGKLVDAYDEIPKGWVKTEGALTAPKGYSWYSNNKSRFGGERKSALVRDKTEEEKAKQHEKAAFDQRKADHAKKVKAQEQRNNTRERNKREAILTRLAASRAKAEAQGHTVSFNDDFDDGILPF